MTNEGANPKGTEEGRRCSAGKNEDWVNQIKNLQVEVVDVGRAHFHARARGDMYVELPAERTVDGEVRPASV